MVQSFKKVPGFFQEGGSDPAQGGRWSSPIWTIHQDIAGNLDKTDCIDQDIYAEFADLFKELAKMGQSERLHKAYFEGFWSSVAAIFCQRLQIAAWKNQIPQWF